MSTLERLAELEKAATPGPWAFLATGSEGGSVVPMIVELRGRVARIAERSFEENKANGELIVAARNALPALIAVARAAEAVYRETLDSGFPEEWADSESSMAMQATVRGRTLGALRAAIEALDPK